MNFLTNSLRTIMSKQHRKCKKNSLLSKIPFLKSVKTLKTLKSPSVSPQKKFEKLKSLDLKPSRSRNELIIAPLAAIESIQKLHELLIIESRINESSSSSLSSLEDCLEYLVYYMMGDTFVRPMGFFSGKIIQEYSDINQYILRRSNGKISWLPYRPSNPILKADCLYLMEYASSQSKLFNLVITTNGPSAEVFVYGEMYCGFLFLSPSTLELKGHLFMAHIDPLISSCPLEEPVHSDCLIEVTDGSLIVFICDQKDIVILPDYNCKMKFIVENKQISGQFGKVNSEVIFQKNNNKVDKQDSLTDLMDLIKQRKSLRFDRQRKQESFEKTMLQKLLEDLEMIKKKINEQILPKESLSIDQIYQEKVDYKLLQTIPVDQKILLDKKVKQELKINKNKPKNKSKDTKPCKNRKQLSNFFLTDLAEPKLQDEESKSILIMKKFSVSTTHDDQMIKALPNEVIMKRYAQDGIKKQSKKLDDKMMLTQNVSKPSRHSSMSNQKQEPLRHSRQSSSPPSLKRSPHGRKRKSRIRSKKETQKLERENKSQTSLKIKLSRRHPTNDSMVKRSRSKLFSPILRSKSLSNKSSFFPVSSELLRRISKNIGYRKSTKLKSSCFLLRQQLERTRKESKQTPSLKSSKSDLQIKLSSLGNDIKSLKSHNSNY